MIQQTLMFSGMKIFFFIFVKNIWKVYMTDFEAFKS